MKKLIYFFLLWSSSSTQAEQPVHLVNNTTSLCGPIPAVCYPTTLQGGMGIGIFLVSFNQINNSSSNPGMLEDFTCTDSTWLTPGLSYNFMVQTGQTYEESLTAWIDFSNDGAFDPSEIIYQDSAVVYSHFASIVIPSNVINTYTPLRMRIGSDYSGNPGLNGCNNALYGQYEDYTIYFGTGNGIKKEEKINPVTITPNPFHSSATINLDNKLKGAELTIYNSIGSLVSHSYINNQVSTMQREGLPNGLYFYKLTHPGSGVIATGRIVIE